MKKTILVLAITMFMGGTLLTSTNLNAQTTEVKQDNSSDIQKYKDEINERIKENEKDIADFRAKMAKEKEEVRMKYDKKVDQLEQKNKELKRKMANYKENQVKSDWQVFKKDFSHDMDELGTDIKELTKKIVK